MTVAGTGPSGPYAARRPSLRDGNLRQVLRAVADSDEPLSRAGVAAVTGLTRSTVSRLVDDLVVARLLDELEPRQGPGRGRPGTPLAPGSRVAALGLQVNPGYLAARVIDLRGRTVAQRYVAADLEQSDPATTLRRLGTMARRLVRSLPTGLRLVGAGVALPGIVSVADARVLSAPNLGWADVGVADLLRGRLGGLTLQIGNEADLAARTVAEESPGRGGRLTDFLYVSGEVGIGGAAVVGGRVFPGRHGWAGEIGHISVDPMGPRCRCGSTGCLEQYAGLHAVLAAAGLPPDASVDLLLERVRSGDPAARGAIEAAARALGVALASAVNVLDIPTIVLGGHLAAAADVLQPLLERELDGRVLSAAWGSVVVDVAPDDPAPGATGAACAVLGALIDDPAGWMTPRAG
ncbi:ROK family protein [Nocardioides sp.]|uniref:ROK family protein n=1 Tax=Nocardioides sp. TaxID=35761 RepID=UPI002ED1D940